MTYREAEAVFSMWCTGKHPLILGFDLANPQCDGCSSNADVFTVLTNKELIRVNQDPLGVPAVEVCHSLPQPKKKEVELTKQTPKPPKTKKEEETHARTPAHQPAAPTVAP